MKTLFFTASIILSILGYSQDDKYKEVGTFCYSDSFTPEAKATETCIVTLSADNWMKIIFNSDYGFQIFSDDNPETIKIYDLIKELDLTNKITSQDVGEFKVFFAQGPSQTKTSDGSGFEIAKQTGRTITMSYTNGYLVLTIPKIIYKANKQSKKIKSEMHVIQIPNECIADFRAIFNY